MLPLRRWQKVLIGCLQVWQAALAGSREAAVAAAHVRSGCASAAAQEPLPPALGKALFLDAVCGKSVNML